MRKVLEEGVCMCIWAGLGQGLELRSGLEVMEWKIVECNLVCVFRVILHISAVPLFLAYNSTEGQISFIHHHFAAAWWLVVGINIIWWDTLGAVYSRNMMNSFERKLQEHKMTPSTDKVYCWFDYFYVRHDFWHSKDCTLLMKSTLGAVKQQAGCHFLIFHPIPECSKNIFIPPHTTPWWLRLKICAVVCCLLQCVAPNAHNWGWNAE